MRQIWITKTGPPEVRQDAQHRGIRTAIGQHEFWNPASLIGDNKTVSGVDISRLLHRTDVLRPQFESLIAMYQRCDIKPHVDRTFSFDEAAAAHHYLHDRKSIGKVVLVP